MLDMMLDALNHLSAADAEEAFTACCGAPSWVQRMVAARPFESQKKMLEVAANAWQALTREQIAAVIAHHPRIGEMKTDSPVSQRAANWSRAEQANARSGDESMLAALAKGNADYEKVYGHQFIVCANGKSAREILGLIEARLLNPPETEHTVTARELRKITMLRLEKLLASA